MSDLPEFALSIRQPWAWAILNAGKPVENRSWPTRFRGPVCLHAAKGMTQAEWGEAAKFISDYAHLATPSGACLERGGIVGVAEVVDCVTFHSSPWFFGPYGFVLRNVRSVPFVPVRGALGFFRWRDKLEAQA